MRTPAILLLALVLMAACNDGGDDAADARTTTTAEEATTTTTTSTPTTSSTGGPACEADALEPPQGELTYLGADVDGDGEDDTAYTQLVEDRWHLRVDLGDGGTLDEELTTVPTDEARIDAPADVDGDGTDELWVVVGNGASATIMGLYDLDGCDLEAAQLGGAAAEFAVGGPVLLLQGLRCDDDGRITHLGATSEDGESYTTLDLTYELRDGELVRVDDVAGTLSGADPALQDYASFDC